MQNYPNNKPPESQTLYVQDFLVSNTNEAVKNLMFCARCMSKDISPEKAAQFCQDLIYFFSKNFRTLPYWQFKEFCEAGATGEYGKTYGFDLNAINGWIKSGLCQPAKKDNSEFMMAQEKIGHLKRQFREMVRELGEEHCLTLYPTIGPMMMSDPEPRKRTGFIGQLIENGYL